MEVHPQSSSILPGGALPASAGGPGNGAPAPPRPPLAPAALPGLSREHIDSIAAAVLARLAQQLDEAAEKRLQAYQQKLTRLAEQSALHAEVNLQAAARWAEDQMVVAAEQKLGALLDRLQASRAALDNQLAKFEGLLEQAPGRLEQAERKLLEASALAIESARREVAAALREEVKNTSATLEGECQALVLDAVTRTVSATLARADQQLAAQTAARLAQASAELARQQQAMVNGIAEQADKIGVAATNRLAEKFEAMADEVGPLLRLELEESLQNAAARLLDETSQTLQQQATSLSSDTLARLQQAGHKLQDGWQEDLQKELAARTGQALQTFQSGMRTLAGEMQAGAARVFTEKLQGLAGEAAGAAALDLRGRIQQQAREATEALGEESTRQLAALGQACLVRSSQELQERLRIHAEEQVDAAIQAAPDKIQERLNRLTHAAGHTLVKITGGQLQKLSGTLFEASAQTLRTEVKQLAEQLQNDLKTYQASVEEQSRKQLMALSRTTVQALNQEACAGVEKFRSHLHSAAQESHQESLRRLEVNFQEALEKLRAAIRVLLQECVEGGQPPQEL